jgi:type IV pilus assembly protein PilA
MSRGERDRGFTLIELLVVMIIIGILAAIAVPVLLNQRRRAVDASLKFDLRTIAAEEETYFTDHQAYLAFGASWDPIDFGDHTVRVSPGNSLSVTLSSSGDAYCIVAAGRGTSATQDWVYISSRSGLQAARPTSCPAVSAF